MTDTNQKLREALRAFEKRGTGFDSCPTRRLPQSDEAKQIDQWWLRYFMDADLSVRSLAHQALSLPTAAPVGERELPPLPSYARWEERIKTLMQQCGHPNSMSIYQAFKQFQNEFEHEMIAYARAALSAGDAVDAGKFHKLFEAMDEGRASIIVEGATESIDGGEIFTDIDDALDAIDAAMRKGQL